MEQPVSSMPQPKHIKSFWAITIVAVIALIAAGLIYWFKFQLTYDEEIQSLEIRLQKRTQTADTVNTEKTIGESLGNTVSPKQ